MRRDQRGSGSKFYFNMGQKFYGFNKQKSWICKVWQVWQGGDGGLELQQEGLQNQVPQVPYTFMRWCQRRPLKYSQILNGTPFSATTMACRSARDAKPPWLAQGRLSKDRDEFLFFPQCCNAAKVESIERMSCFVQINYPWLVNSSSMGFNAERKI